MTAPDDARPGDPAADPVPAGPAPDRPPDARPDSPPSAEYGGEVSRPATPTELAMALTMSVALDGWQAVCPPGGPARLRIGVVLDAREAEGGRSAGLGTLASIVASSAHQRLRGRGNEARSMLVVAGDRLRGMSRLVTEHPQPARHHRIPEVPVAAQTNLSQAVRLVDHALDLAALDPARPDPAGLDPAGLDPAGPGAAASARLLVLITGARAQTPAELDRTRTELERLHHRGCPTLWLCPTEAIHRGTFPYASPFLLDLDHYQARSTCERHAWTVLGAAARDALTRPGPDPIL